MNDKKIAAGSTTISNTRPGYICDRRELPERRGLAAHCCSAKGTDTGHKDHIFLFYINTIRLRNNNCGSTST
jgi:hypothetical protein